MKLPDGNKPIQVGDTSFIYKGVYHPIYWIGKEPYRPRVETLVIKDGKYVYIDIDDDIDTYPQDLYYKHYQLPGGSLDADSTKIEQAEAETNEEALIKVSLLYNTGFSYYQLYKPGFIASGGDIPLEYVGSITDIFIGVYNGPYDKSLVDPKDLAPDIAEHGGWKDIAQVSKYLRKEHISALLHSQFIPEVVKAGIRLNRKDSVNESTSKDLIFDIDKPILEGIDDSIYILMEEKYPIDCYGLPDRKAYPMPDEKHVKSAIKFFNYAKPEEEKELAKNINKKIKEYNMTDVSVGDSNRFKKYYKPISEAFTLSDYASALKVLYERVNVTDDNKPNDEILYATYEQAKNTVTMMVNDIIEGNLPDADGEHTSEIIEQAFKAMEEFNQNQLEILSNNRNESFMKVLEECKRIKPLSIVQEADTDDDKKDDEDDEDSTPTDYTKMADDAGAEDDDDDTTMDTGDNNDDTDADAGTDTDSDTTDDTPTDYTQMADDAGAEDDTTGDVGDDMGADTTDTDNDDAGVTDDTSDTPTDDTTDTTTDISDDTPTDDTGTDDTTDAGTDDMGTGDEDATDYTAMADDAGAEDDTDSTSDDTDTTDNTTDSSSDDNTSDDTSTDDDTTDTEDNNNRFDNKELKNYFLLNSFLSMHETIVDVLDSVSGMILPTPDANGIMAKVVKNLQTIKLFIEKFIQFQFSDKDYAFNLYYYNILINALRLNLNLLEEAVKISEDKTKKNHLKEEKTWH